MLYSLTPMHIPDGFLSVLVSVVLWVVSIAVIIIALRKTSHQLGEKEVPLMGILAAAIFAGQMLNFSVTGGTSGHLLGAALAAILLGPWAAVLVMTTVVAVQALIFQDGGLLALGANIFNMAILGSFVAWTVYRLLAKVFKGKTSSMLIAGFGSAWTSIFIASLACGLQLAFSGTSPANIAVPAMAAIHAFIGLGEGLITVGALAFIAAVRKDLLVAENGSQGSQKAVLIVGGVLILALVVLSPLASAHPDGLEWVAEQKGFLDTAQGILAGIIGALIVFGVATATAISRRKQKTEIG